MACILVLSFDTDGRHHQPFWLLYCIPYIDTNILIYISQIKNLVAIRDFIFAF